MKLIIGHLSTFYHTSILLMAKGDIADTLGVDVKWRLFSTGPEIVNAFERNEINIAYAGLPPAIIGIGRGVKIKCIAGGHVEGTVICGTNKFRGFPEIADLKDILKQFIGLNIGVPGKGSIHDVIIRKYLASFDLKDKIGIVNFQLADQVTEAMRKSAVSAAVGTPALAIAVEKYAQGRILYPSSRIWPNNPSYGIFAETSLIEEERELLENFLILHEEATSFLRNSPSEAAKVISDFVGFIDKEFVMDVLSVSPKYCAQITDGYISSAVKFAEVLRELGYITKEVDLNEIFDLSLIKKIHPEKDHYTL